MWYFLGNGGKERSWKKSWVSIWVHVKFAVQFVRVCIGGKAIYINLLLIFFSPVPQISYSEEDISSVEENLPYNALAYLICLLQKIRDWFFCPLRVHTRILHHSGWGDCFVSCTQWYYVAVERKKSIHLGRDASWWSSGCVWGNMQSWMMCFKVIVSTLFTLLRWLGWYPANCCQWAKSCSIEMGKAYWGLSWGGCSLAWHTDLERSWIASQSQGFQGYFWVEGRVWGSCF